MRETAWTVVFIILTAVSVHFHYYGVAVLFGLLTLCSIADYAMSRYISTKKE